MGENEQRRIGDYELLENLGSGAQGQVWKARCVVAGKAQVAEGEIVAIKMLGRSSGDPNEEKRFRRQANILEQLEHPAICRYIEYFVENEGEFNETQCLVTEYLDGEPLEDRLRKRPGGMHWEEVHPIFQQSLDGLAFAAAREVFHRDLKPSNIFLTREGQAKIIDFGIARQIGGEETSSGDFRGSFDYMAPDFVLIDGFKGDERSDIFSMGVCFFKALTGQLPFQPLGENAHIGYLNRWKRADEVRPSYRHNAFRVLTKLKGFVQGALAVDLEDRFHTFGEMAEALAQIKFRVVRHKGVADYELIDVLGRGGFGEVFKGRVVETGHLVAVKHLFAGRQESRFLKEAKLLQRYKHPDIVSYVDFIEIEGLGDDKEYFLVMEYLPGMPGAALNQRIRKARYGMEPAEVVETFIHFLSALQFLHESPRPIIHRDIKPGNLYAPPGQPQNAKLFDLGVARDVSGTMTTGMIPGTLDYMAPEFAQPGSDRGTPQSDIYAMGVSMYEALTGRKPYPKLPKSDQEAFVQFVARAQNPPEVSYRFPLFREIPQLERICRRAMATHPADRYRTAGQMLQDLTALLEQVAGEKIDPEEAPTRATIADPALLERLRAHAAGKPAFIPEAEMKDLLEEPSSRRTVASRPEWMETEGSFEERPTQMPGSSSPPPSSASPISGEGAGPKRKSSAVGLVIAAAVVLGLLGGGAYLFVSQPDWAPWRPAREVYAERVSDLAQPQAEEAYVRRLLSLIATGREQKLEDDQTYEVWWDNQIAQLAEIGEQIPETYRQAFDASLAAADVPRSEALLADWKNLGDAVPFLGMTPREFLIQSDEMESQIRRFHFTAEINEIQEQLPETIDAANLAQGEAVAKSFRAMRAKRWDGIPAAEREQAYEEIASALTGRIEEFLRSWRRRVLDQYADGEDGAAGVSMVAGMTDRAPSLVALTETLYQETLAELTAEKARFDQERAARETLARLRDAAPETIESPSDLSQAEQAFDQTTQELTAEWEGIPQAEKQAELGEIRSNLTALAEAYVESLSALAEAWYEADEPDVSPQDTLLQDLINQAPDLLRTVGGSYAQALGRVDQARLDRDDRFRQQKIAAERRKMELARQRALEAEAQAQREREQEVAANRARFAAALADLQEQVSSLNRGVLDLAQADAAAQAIQTFSGQRWPDVDVGEIEEAVRELTQNLREWATVRVEALRTVAVREFGENRAEADVPEWDQLAGLEQNYPALVTLVGPVYERAVSDAESALVRAKGVNEFTRAVSSLWERIPPQIKSPDDLARAEEAAVAFGAFRKRAWEAVNPTEREKAIQRIESTLARRTSLYVDELRERGLSLYDASRDGSAALEQLEAVATSAPTLFAMIASDVREATARLSQAAEAFHQRQMFQQALAGLDDAIPETTDPSEMSRLEDALTFYRSLAGMDWPGIETAEREEQLASRLTKIEGLARRIVLGLQERALQAYREGRDGGAFAQELQSMASHAPNLVQQIEGDFARVTTTLEEAQADWQNRNEFYATRDRILDSIPQRISGEQGLQQVQSAAEAYESAKDRAWDGVPAGEKLTALNQILNRIKSVSTAYVDDLRERAIAQYSELEDADLLRENLVAMQHTAPTLVAMLEPAYPAAVQAVDNARGDKERRLRQLEAERRQREREQREAERLAQISADEEQRMQAVDQAWAEVRQQWQAGEKRNLSELYEQILSQTFTLEPYQSAYQETRLAFLNGLKSQLAGKVADANQSIAGFCAYLYQVEDPAFRSFGDNYRVLVEQPPPVAFSIPDLQEIEDVDMGYTKAELIRLQAWKKASDSLDRETHRTELAEQLKILAGAARQQGQLELAARCEMESALLLSEPGVFPPHLEDAGDPPEIFRWRAHASYQPEGSALDVLRDMDRYASRGGKINDFDLRLVLFASYYSWRNAIEGENEYAGRVRRSLDAVLNQADEAAAQRALDFIVQYIEEGTDDLHEFPGLYMMNALTMMNSHSAVAKKAADWLKRTGDRYQARYASISSQLQLLERLLGT